MGRTVRLVAAARPSLRASLTSCPLVGKSAGKSSNGWKDPVNVFQALEKNQLLLLIEAARSDWRDVEPAIFGTLLDPACGRGNFLYVVLEHLKRIEGEVFDTLFWLGEGQGSLDLLGETVDPHQLLGLEINPRAAAIAELVLWIGALQWHFRNRGNVQPAQPIIRNFHNIECRDALIEYDSKVEVLDDDGRPVTHWDGRTTKPHPVTGKEVPDETARVPVYHCSNPRKAVWPQADYTIGYPPFIGAARMRNALGDGYTDTVRKIHSDVGEASDFVMYWWNRAAELLRGAPGEGTRPATAPGEGTRPATPPGGGTRPATPPGGDTRPATPPGADTRPTTTVGPVPDRALGESVPNRALKRFGFVTTNSLRQTFNRRVLEKLRAGEALTAKEKTIHEQGLVSVLMQLHDELDAAVAEAYGWPADLSDDEILEKLVALNAERAAEEAQGKIRYLRPDFQCPEEVQSELNVDAVSPPRSASAKKRGGDTASTLKKQPWPKALPDQVRLLRTALAAPAPVTAEELARTFTRARTDRVAELLETLAALGQARKMDDGRYTTG